MKFSEMMKKFSKEVAPESDKEVKEAELAGELKEVVDNFCEVAEKEAMTAEEKKELVGAFSDLGTSLDAITDVVDQDNLEKLAKVVTYAKKKIAKFCDAHASNFSISSKSKMTRIMKFFSEELPAAVDEIVDEAEITTDPADGQDDVVESTGFCGRRFGKNHRRFADEEKCPECGNSPCTCEEETEKLDEKIDEATDKLEEKVESIDDKEVKNFARRMIRKIRRMRVRNFSDAEDKVDALEDAADEIDAKVSETTTVEEPKNNDEQKSAEDEVVTNFSEVVEDAAVSKEAKDDLVAQFTELGKKLAEVDTAKPEEITDVVEEAKEKIEQFCGKLEEVAGDSKKLDEIKKYFSDVEKDLDEAAKSAKPEEKKEEDKEEEEKSDAEVEKEEETKEDAPEEEVKETEKDDVKEKEEEETTSFSEELVPVDPTMLKDDVVTEVMNEELNPEGVEVVKSVNNFSKSDRKPADAFGDWLSRMI